MTIATKFAYVDDWKLWQFAARKSPKTISERIRLITQFGNEAQLQPASATSMQIMEWLASHTEWSDGSHVTYFSYLGAWYKWLQIQDHRLDNPMIKLGTPLQPDREPHPTSDRGLLDLLTSRIHHKTRGMILLGALQGFRVGMICKVRGEDVDLSVPNIRSTGKRKKQRTYPLHPLVYEFALTMPERGWWFPANSKLPGEHVLPGSVTDVISRAMRRAGVAGTAHSLRHWTGTTLLDEGADLLTVKELLGHASVSSTQIYTKIPDRRRIEAVHTLDPFRYAKRDSA
ncbi:tyrosine-type recombinase/integrase [Rhodococcus sp. 1R11]|uniref:tyrosine-type recombinase/integrase n=1 Tax=Rhodococcus sp. 1R11 TaxID=2559614 RepID=UPI00143071EB|nr:tyrosine-type recombinase/integrase [Rhodococcus sp. 1R11]